MDELEKQFQAQQREFRHFEEWLTMGVLRGWITNPFCAGHDDAPLTDFEMRQWDKGEAPCVICVRLLLLHEGPRYVPPTSIDHSDETRPE